MYFRNYGLRKTWLYKWLKSPFPENPLAVKMLKGPKHCWNLCGSYFIMFLSHFGKYWVGKSLSQWYLKYYHCLLTHWLLMTNILFGIGRIYLNQFKCNHLKNKTFSPFLLWFLKSRLNFLHFPIKDEPQSLCILKTGNCEWLVKYLKSPVWRHPSTFNMLKGQKHY